MDKVKIRFIQRALIHRFGGGPVSVSIKDAQMYIERGEAIAVADMDAPPVKKIIDRPGAKKEVAPSINPSKEAKENQTDSQPQDGKQTVTIRIRK